ncbi:hypothetical protein [Thalassospira sp.]|uniref:hypothetical protein n=1 Tax=Thalassospira sp. TaxID=1912094 RepID=UPI003AA826B8
MVEFQLVEGIVVGGAGGAVAGIVVKLVGWGAEWFRLERDKKQVYEWFYKHTADEEGQKFRSTRTVASWNNLTEDRVRYVCSHHKLIYLSTGKNDDLWSIHIRDKRGEFFA